MSWCRLEDTADENRKIRRLSHEAYRLYWCSVSYSRRHKLGGRMHADDLAVVAAQQGIRNLKAAIADLVFVPSEYGYESGCFEQIGPNLYVIHDHEEYNPPTSKERMRRKRERDAQSDDPDPNGDGSVTSRPVTTNVTRDVNGASPVTPGDTPRAQPRAGYPVPVPEPIPVTTGLRPSVTPPHPPPGDGESPDLLAEYRSWLPVFGEATGRGWREEKLSRDAYLERRLEGFPPDDLAAAARGVALDPWWMGRNSDGIPRCNPTAVLKSQKLQTFIALGRGEVAPRGAGPSRFDAIAGAMEAAEALGPGTELRQLAEGTA